MNVTIKNKTSLIMVVISIVIFFILHIFIYHYKISSHTGWLHNSSPPPFYWEKIELKKEIYPNYLQPFRRLEYRYSEKDKEEVVLIERAKTAFSNQILHDFFKLFGFSRIIGRDPAGDMEIIKGDPKKYHNERADGMLWRGVVGPDYANWLFFLLQYLIVVSFIFFLRKSLSIRLK